MIGPALLAEVAAAIPAAGSEGVEGTLRRRWPQLRFTVCSDDDVPPRLAPALEGDGFNLYLIGGGEHCLALTADPQSAIGVVVAWCAEEG